MRKLYALSVLMILAMLVSFANVSPAGAATTTVTFQEGTATFSQDYPCCALPVDQAVDGYIGVPVNGVLNGWAIHPGVGQDQIAVWETTSDVNASQLDFTLYQYWGGTHNFGRFRLSYTTDDRSTFADGLNSGGDVTANWTVLTGATISGTGGETFTVLGDNSILVSGNNPATTVYHVSFTGSFNGITGIRLEALSDASLPFSGPGRQANGNFTLTEITLGATTPTYSPIIQFDATDLALQNGDAVTLWGGQTAGGAPTYLTNQTPNGMPAVAFTGGGDRMGSNVPLPASAAGDWILVAVIKPQNIGAYHNLADDDPSGRPMLWIDPSFNYELNFGGGTGAKAAGTGANGWDVVIADSRLNQLYVNSPTPNATGRNAIAYSTTKLYDFFHRDGGQTYRGLVAEMRIYTNRSDFAGDFAALHDEMVAKWIAISDADGDGVPDDQDAFPNDPNESVDTDGDGVGDNGDAFPNDANESADTDGDDTGDNGDNCAVANPDQFDTNNDGQGDACDPLVTAVSGPIDPVNLSTGAVNVSGAFSDGDDGDLHNATWDWGDGSVLEAGVVNQASNTVVGAHTYANAGVYRVTLTVVDNFGASDADVYEFIVIYNPDSGFVTGGGWIDSPAGAYAANPTLTGKANFGFNAKYQKGANVPAGNTEFQFKAGDLNFKSSSYEWLVVAGAHAKFKGEGVINGGGNFGFMLTATDSAMNGGGNADAFRIKIWDKANGDAVVYDNLMGAGDDANDATVLGGGSIVIHSDKVTAASDTQAAEVEQQRLFMPLVSTQ